MPYRTIRECRVPCNLPLGDRGCNGMKYDRSLRQRVPCNEYGPTTAWQRWHHCCSKCKPKAFLDTNWFWLSKPTFDIYVTDFNRDKYDEMMSLITKAGCAGHP